MQFAVENRLIVHQLDVKSAYLNAPIDTEIFINEPKGYEKVSDDGEMLVCKLNKSLYGLKQSGRNWNQVLNKFFVDNDFVQSKVDACA